MADTQSIRPTPMAERTLIGALGALCILALIDCLLIVIPHWPDAVAPARIAYLGGAMILAVLGILVMVIAFASPWLGSVRVSAMGAQLDVAGQSWENEGGDIPPAEKS